MRPSCSASSSSSLVFETEYSLGLNQHVIGSPLVLDLEVGLLEAVGAACRGHQALSLKPWWAISSVSVAAFAEPALSAGPCHLTGNAARNCQLRTGLPSGPSSWTRDVLALGVVPGTARTS